MDTTPNPLLEDSILGSNWLNPDYLFNQAILFFQHIYYFFRNNSAELMSAYNNILFFFALFFLTIISYASIRLLEIRAKERKHLKHEIEEYARRQAEREKQTSQGEEISKNERWIKTLNYLFSQHSGDWKLAVIEADSMLEELMGQLGFVGESLGDKLKSATQENFKRLSSAWEVHAIRNRIAHEGASFQLSQHEAKRIIAIYEQIFREFGFI